MVTKIGITIIKKVNTYNNLGILVDNNLKWTEYLETMNINLSKTIGVLYKTIYFLREISKNFIFY